MTVGPAYLHLISKGLLPEDVFELLADFEIPGQPARKSNSRRVVRDGGGKVRVIKSQAALDYAQLFMYNVPSELRDKKWGSKDEHLVLRAHIWYASNRPDLSSEMLMDLLQESGVISNDRWIKVQLLSSSVDKENPRTHIRLYRVIA